MLLKDLFGEALENNYFTRLPYKKKTDKKAIFLFKTVSLLLQQTKVLKLNTNLKIIKFYGGCEAFSPSYDKFRGIMNRHDVICSTPEIIYKYFTLGFLKAEDLKLIIIDECHHTKKDDYMNLIFKHFIFECDENYLNSIRIVGLTASPSDDNTHNRKGIEKNIKALCNNLRSKLICSSILIKEVDNLKLSNKIYKNLPLKNISKYYKGSQEQYPQSLIKSMFINKLFLQEPLIKYLREKYSLSMICIFNIIARIIFAFYSSEEKQNEASNGIFDFTDEIHFTKFEDKINEILLISKINFSDYLKILKNKNEENYSNEIKSIEKVIKKDIFINELMKFVKTLNLIIKYTDFTVIEDFCNYFIETIENKNIPRNSNFSDFMLTFKLEKNNLISNKGKMNFKSEYIFTLEDFFLEKIKEGKIAENKTIIFVHKRIISKYLSQQINKFLTSYGFKTTFVIGCSQQSTVCFNEEQLKENISSFEKDNQCVGLFATNVVEEGIDVPQCDNIINLCEIRSMREFIQKSGRARQNKSVIYTCCDEDDVSIKKATENIINIKKSIEIMKDIIVADNLSPDLYTKTQYTKDIDYYQTEKGAKVYLSYAEILIMHFIGKLFNDGFTFLRSEMKIKTEENEDKTKKFIPYLQLPIVLEEKFTQIFDEKIYFSTQEEAEKNKNRYKETFYLQAIKDLHKNSYLDDNLCFVKNYDDLIHLDYSYGTYNNEPKVNLKQIKDENSIDSEKEKECYISLIDYDPIYIDLNISKKMESLRNGEQFSKLNLQKLGIISQFKITDLNFNIFIPSFQILLLYWINKNVIDDFDFEQLNMPKIDYNYFSKINFRITNYKSIKINKQEKLLIDFSYAYSLFFCCDGEIPFYFFIFKEKFSFSELFVSDVKIKKMLEYIFSNIDLEMDNYSSSYLSYFKSNEINFNHNLKMSIFSGNYDDGFNIDFNEIKKTFENVKKDIKNYVYFLKNYILKEENEKDKFLADIDLIDSTVNDLKFNSTDRILTKKIARNYLNYSKIYVTYFSEKTRKGEQLINECKRYLSKNFYKNKVYNDEETFQIDYLKTYGLISSSNRDYLKTYSFDFNQRMLKYKINIKNLGRVYRKSQKKFIKNFKFLPMEVVHEIEDCSIDKLFLFGMIPTILHKLQHELIYYYQAIMLRNRFKNSFGTLQHFNMNLLIEALTSKSTMESQNYERLEFLGDAVLKFLSSFEIFKKYPHANRDLLFSKRRGIESNKHLFLKAVDEKNKLETYLYSTPVNFKRMNIKGFTQDEINIFNIGYNRSFTKKTLLSKNFRLNEKPKENEKTEIISTDILTKNTQLSNYKLDNDESIKEIETVLNNGTVEEDQESDKTLVYIDHYVSEQELKKDLSNKDDPNSNPNYIKVENLEDFVNKNLEITPGDNKPPRIISNKVMADVIESFTGYMFYMNFNLVINNTQYQSDDFFELPSNLLLDIGVLDEKFNLYNCDSFWLKDLENQACIFNEQQRLKNISFLNTSKYHKFNNINLLYQALTHPELINEQNKSYVNKSYQRLAFLGEAFVSFYVSFYVYNNNPNVNECMLHKLKICGINHHIISSIAIKMKLHDALMTR